MNLREIADAILIKEVRGSLAVDVDGVTEDSRAVTPGCLFVAVRGLKNDGHRFIAQAVAAGAAAVLAEEPSAVDAPQIIVPSTRRIAPFVAHAAAGFPARALTMVGVTGTKGKTTTSLWIERVLRAAGRETGLIGTLAVRASAGGLARAHMATPTTPPAVELAGVLREMREVGAKYVVMEASSEGLAQFRAAGVPFRVAAFTNLAQDHLNFHGTMEAYGRAKGLLFSRLGNDFAPCADGGLPVAVLNADDPWSEVYRAETVQQVVTYGFGDGADVRAADVRLYSDGAAFRLQTFAGPADMRIHMPGRFSVYNALCAAASCLALGLPLDAVAPALAAATAAPVPGRFERVEAGQPYTILVDYSHTPGSLENVLATIREFCRGRVITAVGCGGDRDRGKRPLMAQVAVKYSDLTVLTSDNPRTEDPERILDDMEAGVRDDPRARYVRIAARAEGIRRALEEARADDVVLLAGKGHETYQIVGTTYHDFDDRAVAAQIVRGER